MTSLIVSVNIASGDLPISTPASYIAMDLGNDYLIWTKGSDYIKDNGGQVTTALLNAAAEIINPSSPVTVSKCLLYDYSHANTYYQRLVVGMGLDNLHVFAFTFDGPTATEPQLEAWDTSAHTTILNHCLGHGTALSSMLNGRCTKTIGTGAWLPIAGASNVILLNEGAGALLGAGTLYANLKIVILAAYSTPAAETFVSCVRYTWA
jgi:hypothetical protein